MKLTERKRQSIIDAAIDEFREQGFLGANVTRIAKQAQVSIRTLYKHFETKEELFEVICDIMLEENSTKPLAHYDPSRELEDQLIESVTDYARDFESNDYIGLKRIVFSEFLRNQHRASTFFEKASAYEFPVENLVKEAIDAGELRKVDYKYVTNQLLGLIKTFLFWPTLLTGNKQREPEQIIADSVKMFLSYYQQDSSHR